jgi:catechol 2,3-dioxygenase-like lactoylglutathione lyase family enzyme
MRPAAELGRTTPPPGCGKPHPAPSPPGRVGRGAYHEGMTVDMFAGISVGDYPAALDWYEALLGRSPAFFPNDREAVWEIAEHRFLYVELRPEHAGHGLLTFFVDDFDARVAGAAARGLDPATTETYENGVRKTTYVDPDGNEISFGGPAAGGG